jgi:predicted DNA-binding transcriptional regulator AlpA
MPSAKQQDASADIMTVGETAKFLKLSVSQLYDLTRHRGTVRSAVPIPVIRLGAKSLRFRRTSLENWLGQLEQAA